MSVSPFTQTWPLSEKETTKNNLVFSSDYPGSDCLSYMPLKMQLVLIFGIEEVANDFLHNDVKLNIFRGALHNPVYCSVSETVMTCHKNQNMFTVPMRVNCENCAPKFTVASVAEGASSVVHAMITFPGGKPANIKGAYLMVTGCRGVAVVSATSPCPCLHCRQPGISSGEK